MAKNPIIKLDYEVTLEAYPEEQEYVVRTTSGTEGEEDYFTHESRVEQSAIDAIDNLTVEDQLIMMAMNQLRDLITIRIKKK